MDAASDGKDNAVILSAKNAKARGAGKYLQ